jgi:hypothetical protein
MADLAAPDPPAPWIIFTAMMCTGGSRSDFAVQA